MVFSELNALTFILQASNFALPVRFFSSFGVFIAVLTGFFASINYTRDFILNPNPLPKATLQSYDFIVVGAGSAGSVVASRLSASGQFKVLLLEAGGDPLVLNQIPYLMNANTGHRETDWLYNAAPQVNSSFAIIDHSIPWPRGKSVGGSSNLNSMVYMRGNPKDFDNWAHLTQDNQWTYDNLLPFFKKLENYQGNFQNDPVYHGTGGPIPVTIQRFQPLVDDWIKAGRELGFETIDPNVRQTSTFVPVDVTIANGTRWEVYDGYIKPALRRKNFKIIRYAHVTRINLDDHNKASGVTYIRKGRTFTVLASKEIILSAGAIGSPQLLMLSGIGPSKHLQSVGITPKVDLPGVGQNLADHVGALIGPFILNDTVSFIPERDLSIASAAEYLKQRNGPLTFTYSTGIGMISSTGDPAWPNLALFSSPTGISMDFASGTETRKKVTPGVIQKYVEGFVGRDANFVQINLAKPFSKGSIRLKSNDPFEHPRIDPNYYSEPEDIQAMIAAFKFIVKLHEETQAFQRYGAFLIPNHFPGCEAFTLKTDAYYECYLRSFTLTNWHPSCTCKMGLVEDPLAVLDSNLKVKFVQGLRVVDGSVMPEITNANLNAPIIMIGEKAADLILKTWTSGAA